MNRRWLLLLLLLVGWTASTRGADIERDPPPSETLQVVLDRIRTHADATAWKENGWTDAAIETWIEKLLKQLGDATGKELKAPVQFKEVKPAGDADVTLRNMLRIGKNIKGGVVYDSIVLADGNAELSTVRNSIVIARRVVTTSSIDNSLIISGRYFRCSSARNVANPAGPGSILLSRAYGEINSAQDTTICAPLGLDATTANNVTLVNSKFTRVLNQQNVQIVNKPLPLGEPPASPLEKQLEHLGYMSTPLGVLFRFQGRRLFAEKDLPIVDERGEAIKELAGWTLTHVDLRMALFTSGDQEACMFKAK